MKCEHCDGNGGFVHELTRPACCGQFNRDGSCCGNAVPENYQDIEPCAACEGTGVLQEGKTSSEPGSNT